MANTMAVKIEPHASLEGFFHGLLSDALVAERVELSSTATSYVLHVCAEYAARDAIYKDTARDERQTPALALLVEKASLAPPDQRLDAFRRLGDLALIVSGFFGAHLERSLVGIDYYVKVGGSAYGAASSLSRDGIFRAMFDQLARSYAKLVEVLTRVAEQTTLPVPQDTGSVYERLLRNPSSAALQRRLVHSGLIPSTAMEVA